jgi:hypothetical protein
MTSDPSVSLVLASSAFAFAAAETAAPYGDILMKPSLKPPRSRCG